MPPNYKQSQDQLNASETAPESWYNFEQLMNQRFSRMVNAEEDQDWWRYWVNFKFIYFRLMPHMHPDTRELIDGDYRLMLEAIEKIRKEEKNDNSKKMKILHIQKDFVDTHQAYLFDTLPNAGLANIKADGDIDYDTTSFENIKRITRNQIGTKTAIEREVGGELNAALGEEKNG